MIQRILVLWYMSGRCVRKFNADKAHLLAAWHSSYSSLSFASGKAQSICPLPSTFSDAVNPASSN